MKTIMAFLQPGKPSFIPHCCKQEPSKVQIGYLVNHKGVMSTYSFISTLTSNYLNNIVRKMSLAARCITSQATLRMVTVS